MFSLLYSTGSYMLNIKERTEKIVAEYTDTPVNEFYQASNFTELNIDSLSLVEIIFDIEETFNISIPNEADLEKQGLNFSNFVDVLNIVTILTEKELNNV